MLFIILNYAVQKQAAKVFYKKIMSLEIMQKLQENTCARGLEL